MSDWWDDLAEAEPTEPEPPGPDLQPPTNPSKAVEEPPRPTPDLQPSTSPTSTANPDQASLFAPAARRPDPMTDQDDQRRQGSLSPPATPASPEPDRQPSPTPTGAGLYGDLDRQPDQDDQPPEPPPAPAASPDPDRQPSPERQGDIAAGPPRERQGDIALGSPEVRQGDIALGSPEVRQGDIALGPVELKPAFSEVRGTTLDLGTITRGDPEPDPEDLLRRRTKEGDGQAALFDLPPDWRKEWWGMPDFSMGDATAEHKITFNFASWDDVEELKRRLGLPNLSRRTDSAWFPAEQVERPGDWRYVASASEKSRTQPRYPIYIPSKGRFVSQTTMTQLKKLGVPFRIVVEPPEEKEYAARFGQSALLVLPFHDLGQGSIPARNWIWDHALAEGHDRHWIIDDNVTRFYRMNINRRIPVADGTMFRAIEDFTDRYDNVAFSGPNDLGFAPDREPDTPAFYLNTRIYSMTLINSALDYRWRGTLNEDTDICLRALKDGWATILFNAFLGNKAETMKVAGGNTDTVYATEDHRREFAESLVRQHPDVVKVVWKFNRWHHQVDYSPFKRNRLQLREGVTPRADSDNFGMKLRKV